MKKEETYLEMTDAFLRQVSKGETPEKITKDLRFCMDLQQKKLRQKDVRIKEEYIFDNEAVTGAAEASQKNNRTPFCGITAFRETVRIRDFYHGDRKLLHRREPVNFYAVITDREGSRDFPVNCPNCGNAAMASKLQEACPYCGTHFSMSELYPRISSCYCTNNIVERFGMNERLRKTFTRIAVILFILFLAVSILQNREYSDLPFLARAVMVLFQAGLMSVLMTFTAYMVYSIFLLGRTFRQLGSVLPMAGAGSSAKRLKKLMEKYDPYFFVRIFEGKLVSLMQAVLYSSDRSNLSIYEGHDDLTSFDDLADMDYRGAFKLKEFREKEQRICVLLEVFTENCYMDDRLKRKNERILVRMERRKDAVTDPGFSIHAVSCRSCGASFDAMHVRNCPYCGTRYSAADEDWVITEIRRK